MQVDARKFIFGHAETVDKCLLQDYELYLWKRGQHHFTILIFTEHFPPGLVRSECSPVKGWTCLNIFVVF